MRKKDAIFIYGEVILFAGGTTNILVGIEKYGTPSSPLHLSCYRNLLDFDSTIQTSAMANISSEVI